MNLTVSSLHRGLVSFLFAVGALPLVGGCVTVQTHSFQSEASPDRLPELAYNEVRKGPLADHLDHLGPVQIELGARTTAEFPVILQKGQCYRAVAVEEDRGDAIRLAFLNEDFVQQDAAVGRGGVATLLRCPESVENLILSIEGTTKRARVVVGVLKQP